MKCFLTKTPFIIIWISIEYTQIATQRVIQYFHGNFFRTIKWKLLLFQLDHFMFIQYRSSFSCRLIALVFELFQYFLQYDSISVIQFIWTSNDTVRILHIVRYKCIIFYIRIHIPTYFFLQGTCFKYALTLSIYVYLIIFSFCKILEWINQTPKLFFIILIVLFL